MRDYLSVERVAGWDREYELLGLLRDLMCDEECGEAKIYSLEVLKWIEYSCEINNKIKCVAQPPLNIDAYVEAVLTNDLGNCRNKIVLVSTTEYPDNIWILYNEAVERGAVGVIFYDYYPSRRRRIVINGDWHYSFTKEIKTPVPAVQIRLEDYSVLKRYVGRRVSLHVKSSLVASRGYTLEYFIENDPSREIIYSVHHDSWFSGFRDDAIGVLSLILIARYLLKMISDANYPSIRLISFTAEEFGDPRNVGWYWAYGSRYYLSNIYKTDLYNRNLLSVVADTAFKEPVRVSYSTPELADLFKEKFRVKTLLEDYGHPYMDSISFIQRGVPTISLHNFPDMYSIYHTDLDIEYSGWRGFLEVYSRSIVKVFSEILSNIPEPVHLLRDLEKYSRYLPSDLRNNLLSVLNKSRRHMLLYSCFAKTLLRPVVYNYYRDLYNDIHLHPIYEILRRVSEDSVENIIIPGEEEIFYVKSEKELNRLKDYVINTTQEFIACFD